MIGNHNQKLASTYVYTVSEAADVLRISRVTVYKLIASGALASFKIGSRRLIAAAAIDDAIQTLSKIT